jgi:OOP family OmpA-OmpF porin
MKIKILLLCMVGMVTLYTSDLNAQVKPGSFTLSPFIGSYFFDGDQNLLNTITYGASLGYNFTEHWGIEGSLNYLNTKAEIGGADVDGFLYRIDGLYNFTPQKRWTPYLAVGLGGLNLDENDFIANYGVGFKYFFNDKVAFRADLRHVLPFPGNNFLYTVGLSFAFGGEKKAEVVATPQPVVQQPVVPKDSDGDGVYDDQDQCPNTPAGTKVDSKGCPLDSDGDGVYDYLDQCPNTPAGVKVDSRGCPPDSDGDGVYDYLDQCPNTPAGTKVDSKGCPLDSDGDGVYDNLDQCPNTPKGAVVDQRGCWVLNDVNFDFDKTNIKAGDAARLDSVIPILENNPSLKIEIQGYTDNKGPADYNQKLSERRAQAVMKYIVKKGIDQSRLNAVGFGLTKPVASNDTREGRAENRRVELNPVE